MYYFVTEKSTNKPVDFNFKLVADSQKALFHSKEDALYFLDCNTRDTLGADKIDSVRSQFAVNEAE